MKRMFTFLIALAMVFGLTVSAHATLINRGTDTLGNRLIYDTDLNITWYDYTNSADIWQNQKDWADALSVTFESNVYDDWRLPTTVDGLYEWGYDGSTTAGYSITTSEMGHLFYTELGNLAYYDTNGSPQAGGGLTNTGDFQNLQAGFYWSGTEYSAGTYDAWIFGFNVGVQNVDYTDYCNYCYYPYALAVRPGDVSTQVPEPSTLLLIGSGLVGLAGMRRRFKV